MGNDFDVVLRFFVVLFVYWGCGFLSSWSKLSTLFLRRIWFLFISALFVCVTLRNYDYFRQNHRQGQSYETCNKTYRSTFSCVLFYSSYRFSHFANDFRRIRFFIVRKSANFNLVVNVWRSGFRNDKLRNSIAYLNGRRVYSLYRRIHFTYYDFL